MSRPGPFLLAVLLTSTASAEGPGPGGRGSESRLAGASSIRPLGKGFLSVGGSELRYLAPGARRWKGLHRLPGDNLYRIAVDEAGERVLATWEKDPSVHLFAPRTGRHLQLPRPQLPHPRNGLTLVHSLAFSTDGASALIFMFASSGGQAGTLFLYRAPLDGSGQPEELVRAEAGLLLATGRFGAVYAYPPSPRQKCHGAECFPSTSRIVAHEVSGAGVSENILLTAEQAQVRTGRPIRSQDPDLLAFELEPSRTGQLRAVLLYRPGQAGTEYRQLSPPTYTSQPTRMAIVSRAPRELLSLKTLHTDLELHREPLDGPVTDRVTRLPSRHNYTSPVYGFGLRSGGTPWLHWGDHLALVDAGGTMRGVSLKPLAGRMTEWAGVAVYVEEPEALWIGVEVGGGRDYFRLSLADAERRAAPWPAKPRGCADLPDTAALMRWPVQILTCSGGMPNPRAPKPKPPNVIKVLPDGSKIIDAGERGCLRAREEPCTNK